MLDKEVFFAEMDNLINFYPNWKLKLDDPTVMKKWYERFYHMDNDRFIHMVKNYINNENFNPTVAGLFSHDTLPRKSVTQLRHEKEMRDYEKKLKKEREQENART